MQQYLIRSTMDKLSIQNKMACVYFVKDDSENCEIVDYNKAW